MTKYLLLIDKEWHWCKARGYCFTCHPEDKGKGLLTPCDKKLVQ